MILIYDFEYIHIAVSNLIVSIIYSNHFYYIVG
jgi:hypothetical protein